MNQSSIGIFNLDWLYNHLASPIVTKRQKISPPPSLERNILITDSHLPQKKVASKTFYSQVMTIFT